MREILFRGKRIDSNGWVYGHPVADIYGAKYPIIIHSSEYNDGNNVDIDYDFVISETVGQYTGLTDKNGKKIFEGDIIKSHGNDSYVIKYGEYIPRNYCLARYYDKPTIGFYAYDGERCFQLSTNSRCYEVIGNIHDNPELAEGLL